MNQKHPLPPREFFEARMRIGSGWALLAFVLVLVGVIASKHGLPRVGALLVVSASAAASVIAAAYIVPTFLRLRRLARERGKRDRDRRE